MKPEESQNEDDWKRFHAGRSIGNSGHSATGMSPLRMKDGLAGSQRDWERARRSHATVAAICRHDPLDRPG
jgi:hypothetical protein